MPPNSRHVQGQAAGGGLISEGGNFVDVYPIVVVGKGAYAVTDLDRNSAGIIRKPLGTGEDPLNQRASQGWKMKMTVVRLDELKLVRIESAVTDV